MRNKKLSTYVMPEITWLGSNVGFTLKPLKFIFSRIAGQIKGEIYPHGQIRGELHTSLGDTRVFRNN